MQIPGVQPPTGNDAIYVQSFDVGPRYFLTMGTPLLRGREFGDADGERAPRVAIVNEAMAKQFFAGNAVGRVVSIDTGGAMAPYEIVGVVATAKYRTLSEPPTPVLFRAERQSYHPRLTLVAQVARGSTAAVLADIHSEVASLDPKLVVLTAPLEQS